MPDVYSKSLELHKKLRGKIRIEPAVRIKSRDDLSLLYTPGVAEASRVISKDLNLVNELTMRRNLVAIVSDGSAVLGLGEVGPEAAMPVMEGKALLFREYAGVEAIPLCINTHDVDEIVRFAQIISPTFGGINFEDISAPRCFEIEEKLRGNINIPFFHDDQHGTAVVVGAALKNALRVVGKNIEDIKIVISGVGAAGKAIAEFLFSMGAENIKVCGRKGVLNPDDEDAKRNKYRLELARRTNPDGVSGSLRDVLKGADVFIGVSAPNILSYEDISRMNKDAIVMAMANPVPEIMPEDAYRGGARIVATGRSDFPNQVNNVLAFPGIFRGALIVEAKEINEDMKKAAANAIADFVPSPTEEKIVPSPNDRDLFKVVAYEVARATMNSGVARRILKDNDLANEIDYYINR